MIDIERKVRFFAIFASFAIIASFLNDLFIHSGCVMAKAKSEAGFDQELYEKLREAVVQGKTTNVQSLLQRSTKDEARDLLNRNCPHDIILYRYLL